MPVPPFRRRPSRFAASDVAVAVWVLLWVAVGSLTALEIREFRTYGDTLVQSGEALDTAGSALQTLGAVPVVGDGPQRLGDEVRATAEEVRASARTTEASVENLSVLIGLSITCIPTLPAVAAYLAWRSRCRREAEAVRGMLAAVDGGRVEELLARRAVDRVPYDLLLAASPDPWQDLEQGRFRLLANAELTRLGIARRGGVRSTS